MSRRPPPLAGASALGALLGPGAIGASSPTSAPGHQDRKSPAGDYIPRS